MLPRQIVQEVLRDSTLWNRISPRPDDIIIASCYKAGTTLTQQMINLLLNGEQEFETMRGLSPWVESTLHTLPADVLEGLPSPRFLKTHLHPQALPWHEEWKYIYLGRDGRDVGVSLFHHSRAMAGKLAAIGHDNGSAVFSDFWDQWVETGEPHWDFWENVASWWQVRHYPNVLLVHYADLVNNKRHEAKRIARFLGCEWNEAIGDRVCERSSLEYMRQLELNGKLGAPVKNKQTTVLVRKGKHGEWQGLLSQQQLHHYEALLAQKLEPECAAWLGHGGPV